jgi:hypothetical protein
LFLSADKETGSSEVRRRIQHTPKTGKDSG